MGLPNYRSLAKLLKPADLFWNINMNSQHPPHPNSSESLTGRSVFSVEITPEGVMVKTRFLAEDGRILDLPAIFPSPDYALAQIDELRALVSQKFAEAVKLSGQAMADTTHIVDHLKKSS